MRFISIFNFHFIDVLRCLLDFEWKLTKRFQAIELGISDSFIGNPGDNGEFAIKLAHIKPVDREKWWRKHPEVLKLRYGSKARIPKTT